MADDGEGENGVYTAALLDALREPGLQAEAVFKRVRARVADETRGRQVPWESSSLTGNFVFNAPVSVTVQAPGAASAPGGVSDETFELAFWNSIQGSTSAAMFDEYLRVYPQGRFAGLARLQAEALRAAPAAGPVAAPAPAREAGPAPGPAPAPAPAIAAVRPPPAAASTPAPAPARVSFPVPEMVRISAGCFQMGSPASEAGRDPDERQHRACVDAFGMGKTEVTVGQFRCFLDASGHRTDHRAQRWSTEWLLDVRGRKGRVQGRTQLAKPGFRPGRGQSGRLRELERCPGLCGVVDPGDGEAVPLAD